MCKLQTDYTEYIITVNCKCSDDECTCFYISSSECKAYDEDIKFDIRVIHSQKNYDCIKQYDDELLTIRKNFDTYCEKHNICTWNRNQDEKFYEKLLRTLELLSI